MENILERIVKRPEKVFSHLPKENENKSNSKCVGMRIKTGPSLKINHFYWILFTKSKK